MPASITYGIAVGGSCSVLFDSCERTYQSSETTPSNIAVGVVRVVSVVIPAFNSERVIGKAIESVLAQTFQDFEIIVVDDGSRDETVKKALALACSEPRLRVFRSETNRGAQATRNAGAQAARGKWLAFLDSDDEWLPRSLELRLRVAAVENVEVVHSDCYILRKDMPQELFNIPAFQGEIYSELLGHPGPMFQAMLMSVNSFRQIGGLDETIVAYQEWDTAIRLGKRFRFGYENAPTFVYNCQGSDTISKDERRAAQGYSQVVRKHLLPIMLRLGPRAISNHYRVIARHYSLAGDAKQARMSNLIAFLWWPTLGVRSYARFIKRSTSGMIVTKTHNEHFFEIAIGDRETRERQISETSCVKSGT